MIASDFSRKIASLDIPEVVVPFAPEEYAQRIGRLRSEMDVAGIDLLLLTAPDAMCWVSGYELRWYKAHGASAWRPLAMIAIHRQSSTPVLFDGAEHAEVIRRTTTPNTDVRLLPRDARGETLSFILDSLAGVLRPGAVVGMEWDSHVPSPAVFLEVDAALRARGAHTRDATSMIRGVRRQKSPAELECIETAARICDDGITHLASVLRPGMTELQVWAELERGLINAGGEPAAIHEWAQRIERHASRHSISSRRELGEGDHVAVDPCGVFHRYHANRTAVLSLGEPADEFVERMELLAGAFPVLRRSAHAGARVSDVAAQLREYYAGVGLWAERGETWVGGYELGLSFPPDWVGEWTFTVAEEDSEDIFLERSVTNFESHFTLALYDTVVYEREGARTLSSLPYEIIAV
ncbi:M24 family metallopeptidase [Leucobacter rhizosphaerae]|uniref:M24 family metallopeptidase n=1 Tax=Leucobacter rhizosphaerae TaxID=2932245 RepID=A0ABY4FRP7_9MICO|nr:M24 family metallopeptidase [Leucobacter rhizosphaerae]UOQ58960.1 M24 family metallopeptidase [Leucobacter rhizosphaerae]